MYNIKLKKDGDNYTAIIETDFSISKIYEKSKNKMAINITANVKGMQQAYKDKLNEMAGMLNYNKKEERENFNKTLREYVDYHILEALSIKKTPLRIITDDEGKPIEVEGLEDDVDYKLIVEEDNNE
jgi:hypothetical protein